MESQAIDFVATSRVGLMASKISSEVSLPPPTASSAPSSRSGRKPGSFPSLADAKARWAAEETFNQQNSDDHIPLESEDTSSDDEISVEPSSPMSKEKRNAILLLLCGLVLLGGAGFVLALIIPGTPHLSQIRDSFMQNTSKVERIGVMLVGGFVFGALAFGIGCHKYMDAKERQAAEERRQLAVEEIV